MSVDTPLRAGPPDAETLALATPALWRRMAAFLYEGVLLFGVLMIAGYLYSSLTQMRNAMVGTTGLQAFLLLVLAIYFSWFWTHGGQTVAMRAWHIKVVDAQGRQLTQARALLRFALAWLWFLPALAAIHWGGLQGKLATFGTLTAGVIGYALLAWLHPKQQFWHDVVAGTRLVTWRPALPAKTKSAASATPTADT